MKRRLENTLQQNISYLNNPEHFCHFDDFMIEKWKVDDKKDRKAAFQNFYSRVKGKKIATPETIRSWFGIGGFSKPKRTHIFHMALELEFTKDQLQEYFVSGIFEPGVQINDYREAFFLYGLYKGMGFESCLDMISLFERKISLHDGLIQDSHTEQLWRMFEEHIGDSKEDFLYWMCKHISMFKGYSKASLYAFVNWKEKAFEYVRKDAYKLLVNLLKEMGYFSWLSDHDYDVKQWEKYLTRYVYNMTRRKKDGISKEDKNLLSYLRGIALAPESRTSALLDELYASTHQPNHTTQREVQSKKNKLNLPESIPIMSNKHVSNLLHVAKQKEKEFLLSQLCNKLEALEDEAACPDYAKELIATYSAKEPSTVKSAKKITSKLLVEQKKGCKLVQRDDLLPLIHYVCQREYLDSQAKNDEEYDKQKALDLFVNSANEELERCQMKVLNASYEMDYLLLSCYGDNEMYSLSDALEAAL